MDRQDAIDRARELWPQVSAAISQRLGRLSPDDVRENATTATLLAGTIKEALSMCGLRRRMP